MASSELSEMLQPTSNTKIENEPTTLIPTTNNDWISSLEATNNTLADEFRWQSRNDVQEALHESARDRIMMPPQPARPRKSTLDQRIEDLATNLPWLSPHTGSDTLAFIDPPLFQGNKRGLSDESAHQHFCNPFRVRSQDIENLHSPYFSRMMEQDYQQLIRSKRGLKTLPPSIRYVLDLTPKSEGEEAVRYLQDLSCPAGVLHWFESFERWHTPKPLVLGRDEFTEDYSGGKRRRISETSEEDQESDVLPRKEEGEMADFDPIAPPSKQKPVVQLVSRRVVEPEYTPLRHRLAIERFLLALSGQDPKFDSAAKVYTTVMASKVFNIWNYNPLTDHVVVWLYADPNSRFLEALPEATLSMAEVLRSESLARDAFAVLVGEAVLDSAVHYNQNCQTFLGRRRTDIDETWQSRVEYARNSLTDRVQTTFELLAGNRMEWVDDLNEMKLIRKGMGSSMANCDDVYHNLSNILKDYFRGAIYHVMASSYDTLEQPSTFAQVGGDSLYPKTAMITQWDLINPQSRIYTRTFWDLLSTIFFTDMYHANSDGGTNFSRVRVKYFCEALSENSKDLVGTSLYKEVKQDDLIHAVKRCFSFFPHAETKSFEMKTPATKSAPLVKFNFPKAEFFSSYFQTYPSRAEEHDSGTRCNWSGCENSITSTATCSHCFGVYCSLHKIPTAHKCTEIVLSKQSASESLLANEQSDSRQGLPHRPVQEGDIILRQVLDNNTSSTNVGLAPAEQSTPARHSAAVNLPERVTTNSNQNEGNHTDLNAEHAQAPQEFDENPVPTITRHWGHLNWLARLMSQARDHIRTAARTMAGPPQGGQLNNTIDVYLTMTLLCLNEEETKFLPLWAGGCDDGTSGVYSSHVPFAIDGFQGPPASTDELAVQGLGENYDMMDDRKTIATSAFVNDGYGDTVQRHKVYAMSEVESVDWDFMRKEQSGKSLAPPEDGNMGVISDSGMVTPTKIKTAPESDVLSDAFVEFDDDDSNSFMSDNIDGEDELDDNASNESDTEDSPSCALETESISYGGFSDPGSSFIDINTPPQSSSTLEPENNKPRASENKPRLSEKALGKRPVANDIGSELKSSLANVYYVYKDGPEEDSLMTRP